ncbi:MAG: M1 family aminopeptidase [Pseudomonadota bacterium]|nr:M1 family aminopeptidase [Pseudomonadota bacterium]
MICRGILIAVVVVFGAMPAWGQSQPAPIHHDLGVTLDPAERKVVITDDLRVMGAGNAVLKLPEGWGLNRMKLQGPSTKFNKKDGVWRLTLGGGAEHRVSLRYKGNIEPIDTIRLSTASSKLSADPEGVYLPSRGGWYPDFGDAMFTYSIEIDVPEDQRVVAPGALVDEAVAGGRYRARFAVDWPAEDIVVAAGPYQIDERRHGDIRLRTYFHPAIADLSAAYLEKSAGYLDRYGAAIGDYPFPAFHVVSTPLQVGLGFPGMAFMGTRVLRLPFILETSLGHEVLHNWWGNGVYVDHTTGNWSEGLTTYMADYAFAQAKGRGHAMRLRWLSDYAAMSRHSDEPATTFVSRYHGASRILGYNKVAMIFVMLHDDIGAEFFDGALRLLWQRFQFQRASWHDLRGVFEETSGRDLGRFFGQWVEQAGAPALRLKSVRTAPAGSGHQVTFTLIQDDPAYDLSVPVTVETGDGPRQFRIRFEDRIERFTINVDAVPSALEIDPDAEIFRRLAVGEVPVIMRSITLAPDVIMAVAIDDEDLGAAADKLAAVLVDGEVERVDRFAAPLFNKPLILVGAGTKLARLLSSAELFGAPLDIYEKGDMRVWTATGGRGFPVLVIEVKNAAQLTALTPSLPHYGAKSYLVFEDGDVIDSGVWPAKDKPLRFEF